MDIFKRFFEENKIFRGHSYSRMAYIRIADTEWFIFESQCSGIFEICFDCGNLWYIKTHGASTMGDIIKKWNYMEADAFIIQNC